VWVCHHVLGGFILLSAPQLIAPSTPPNCTGTELELLTDADLSLSPSQSPRGLTVNQPRQSTQQQQITAGGRPSVAGRAGKYYRTNYLLNTLIRCLMLIYVLWLLERVTAAVGWSPATHSPDQQLSFQQDSPAR